MKRLGFFNSPLTSFLPSVFSTKEKQERNLPLPGGNLFITCLSTGVKTGVKFNFNVTKLSH